MSGSIDKLNEEQLKSIVLEYLAKTESDALREAIENTAASSSSSSTTTATSSVEAPMKTKSKGFNIFSSKAKKKEGKDKAVKVKPETALLTLPSPPPSSPPPSTSTSPSTSVATETTTTTNLPPEKCSITFEQLNKIAYDAKKQFGLQAYEQMTMYDIVQKMVLPTCARTKLPYALSLNPGGLEMQTFCTHCWREKFDVFVSSVQKALENRIVKPNLWICAFALYQGNSDEIAQQLGHTNNENEDEDNLPPLSESPFVRALKEASDFLVVRNYAVDIYSRIWCVCELIFAMDCDLVPQKTIIAGPDDFGTIGTSVKDADAYSPIDKRRILKFLLKKHGTYEKVDEIVREFRSHTVSLGKTIRAKSQKEVADKFAGKLEELNALYDKTATAYVRKAVMGETITTTIFGEKETEKTVTKASSHIVCGPVAFETYIITNFLDNYDADHPIDIEIDLPPYRRLRELGFKEYRSKRQVLAIEVDKDDIEWFRSGMDHIDDDDDELSFFAPWGELMVVKEGDYLVMTYPPDNEVYRIEKNAFLNTYSQVGTVEMDLTPKKDGGLSRFFCRF